MAGRDLSADLFDTPYQSGGGTDLTAALFGGTPSRSDAYKGGRDANSSLQGLVSAVNGPLLGFGDEVLGALGAPLKAMGSGQSLGDSYRELRDGYRGMQDARRDEAPWTTGLTSAMTAAPMFALNPLGKLAAPTANAVSGILPRMLNATGTGFGYGSVQGAGDSKADNIGDVAMDALQSGGAGAVFGGAAVPVASVLGAVGGNVVQRLSTTAAADHARQKVAEALSRDARGSLFQSGNANPMTQVASRFGKLGDEAVLADAGGQNTKQLLDTMATLPGRTKDAAERLIHDRQAGRAGRMITAAEDGLSTQGQRLNPHIEQWIARRETAAAPLYNQLREITVQPSQRLQSIVASADEIGAVGLGREMSAARQMPFTLNASPTPPNGITNLPNNRWSMNDLDHVKQGLDQKIAKQWDAVEGKLTPLGAAYQSLKNKLVNELDSVTTNPNSGVSLYKSARDAFSGPSAIIDAARQGRSILSKDGATISDIAKDMSASEMQAFRLGAYESLRNKLGKESGQTEILKMWKEPATREKLKAVFGDEVRFRSFATDVAKESRLKGLESVGRGSQTAARQYGAGDVDASALSQAGTVVTQASAGNVLGTLGSLGNAWNRVATPQPVRDQIGSLLMSKGQSGKANITDMADIIQMINERNGLLSSGMAATGGSMIGSQLVRPMGHPGLIGQ